MRLHEAGIYHREPGPGTWQNWKGEKKKDDTCLIVYYIFIQSMPLRTDRYGMPQAPLAWMDLSFCG